MTAATPARVALPAWAELLPALERLDALLERATVRARAVYAAASAGELYRGQYVSEADVDSLFARPPGDPLLVGADEESAPDGRLRNLATVFGLTAFDLDVVVLALAPELDRRYERLYAYLQDNANLRRPTVDLAMQLFCASAGERLDSRRRFTASAPLLALGVVRLIAESEHGTLLASTVKLDEQIVAYLLREDGDGRLDARLADHCRHSRAAASPLDVAPADALVRLSAAAASSAERDGALRLQFAADSDDAAGLLASALERDVLELDLAGADVARVLPVFGVAARLRGAVPLLTTTHAVLAPAEIARCAAFVRSWPGVLAVRGPSPAPGLELRVADGDAAGFDERRACWARELTARGIDIPEAELDSLATQLRVSPSEIREATGRALWRALWRAGGDGDARVEPSDLYEAACELTTAELATLARRQRPAARWDDLVLPPDAIAQLRELCARVLRRRRVFEGWGFERRLSLGRGTIALFAGPAGTGKTLAAEAVAAELRLDLCKIDLSSVVSKYIGETEKNLSRVFAAAERANAILFFDEADALFGKRSEVRDAHDRYANIEISYLLQRMEEYDGVAILATNLRQNLDESFIRRIAFMVHFPFPDEASRLAIWRSIWPVETPLAADVDVEALASEFKLAGGNIKNVALAAAFLAADDGGGAVTMAHVLHATRREYQKLGKALAGAERPPLVALPAVHGDG